MAISSNGGVIDLTAVFGPSGIKFGNNYYTDAFINSNGAITFGAAISTFSPSGPASGVSGRPIIALYWKDLDTRNTSSTLSTGGNSQGSNLVYIDNDPAASRIVITWDDVAD